MTHETWQEPESATETEPSATGTPAELKALVQELLRNGFIESAVRATDFNAALRLRNDIDAVLEPLDLRIDLDELRGLAAEMRPNVQRH